MKQPTSITDLCAELEETFNACGEIDPKCAGELIERILEAEVEKRMQLRKKTRLSKFNTWFIRWFDDSSTLVLVFCISVVLWPSLYYFSPPNKTHVNKAHILSTTGYQVDPSTNLSRFGVYYLKEMVDPNFPKGIRAFTQRFSTEEACLAYIRFQRWGAEDGFQCPRCACATCWDGKTRNRLVCTKCRYEAQITAGTAFHAQRKGLVLWFLAMYLATSSKQGISAKELSRQLNISYPTAWAWLHKLRACMVDPNRTPLQGAVEVDETYIGGQAVFGQHGRSTIKKTAVACAVEKNGLECGRVRLAVIPNATKKKLQQFLDGTLKPETVVSTDGWRGYLGIERSGFAHIRLMAEKNEKAHVFLPRVHRVFSLVKRWLLATHQGAVSRKHLNAYLEEYTFRFNRRRAHNLSHSFQRLMEGCMRSQCRPYWQLVGRTAPRAPMRSPGQFYYLTAPPLPQP